MFSTRSPDRPNPIGLHRVRVVAVDGLRVLVHGLEAIDGTPVADVKPVLDKAAEHLSFMREAGEYDERRRRAATAEIDAILRDRLWRAVIHRVPAFDRYADQVGRREYDPYTAVDRILNESGLAG